MTRRETVVARQVFGGEVAGHAAAFAVFDVGAKSELGNS
jgi:hypothetical protein